MFDEDAHSSSIVSGLSDFASPTRKASLPLMARSTASPMTSARQPEAKAGAGFLAVSYTHLTLPTKA